MQNKASQPPAEPCITQVAATVETLLGVPPRADMAAPIKAVLGAARGAFGMYGDSTQGCSALCDRVFLYHPDAIARWLVEKRVDLFATLYECTDLALDMRSVVPPVTPVCFASMHSGYLPERHGIQKYEKPVLAVDTLFDDLPRAGKRVAIVCTQGDSIAEIFKRRSVDYFIYPTKQACNEKALALIEADAHDVIVLYNGDYDHWMHRFGPEGKRPLRALRENIETYRLLRARIAERWTAHNTVLAFAPDHGCHRVLGLLGTHGKDISADMEICHWYTFLTGQN